MGEQTSLSVTVGNTTVLVAVSWISEQLSPNILGEILWQYRVCSEESANILLQFYKLMTTTLIHFIAVT
jgi:CBS domain containing-hemolysin-like protein